MVEDASKLPEWAMQVVPLLAGAPAGERWELARIDADGESGDSPEVRGTSLSHEAKGDELPAPIDALVGSASALWIFGKANEAVRPAQVLVEGGPLTPTAARALEELYGEGIRDIEGQPSWHDVRLDFADGRTVVIDELHETLCRFPVFGFRLVQSDEGFTIDVIHLEDDAGGADLAVRLESALTRGLGEAEVTMCRPDALRPDLVVRDARSGQQAKPSRVVAMWVGDETPELLEGAAADAAIFAEQNATELSIRVLPADERRYAIYVAGTTQEGTDTICAAFDGEDVSPDRLARTQLVGWVPAASTRPMLARPATGEGPLWVDPERCDNDASCQAVCPVDAIRVVEGAPPQIDALTCIHCQLCVERCPNGALRPTLLEDMWLEGADLVREAPRLAGGRLRSVGPELAGPLAAPMPRLTSSGPLVVLGLATVTMMEHAAALLIDGQLVAAVEEERVTRERHYRWRPTDRGDASLASDPTLPLEAPFPQGAIAEVLKLAGGVPFDRVDAIAVNGIPVRLRRSYATDRVHRPPPVLRAGRVVFVPHHMAHAASAVGLSDFSDGWVVSVDGRGDYETASLWRVEGNEFELIDAEGFRPDRSIGGVYQTITQILGFGTHGQGSTMALAALGQPKFDMSACLGLDADGAMVLSEWGADHDFKHLARGGDEPLTQDHYDLAASVQDALEATVGGWLAARLPKGPIERLAMCGGVALNCRMNGELRRRFRPGEMHVPPGANDAGTAIGAALVAHREITGELPRLALGHTHLGPAWSDDAVARSLTRLRVPFERSDDVARRTAELLDSGAIVCWFQGREEFGPRALGGRSILADPRNEQLKARLNGMKSRQPWRPFGASILAGRQGEWFEEDWDSRFMLFAVTVRPERRGEVPVVVHLDGSTRPQVVHADEHPRYHEMIEAFRERTGVPMVVNTSFNRGGEPIVHTPVQALRSFKGLGADYLVLGDCVIAQPS